jgi:hypothetical protein
MILGLREVDGSRNGDEAGSFNLMFSWDASVAKVLVLTL